MLRSLFLFGRDAVFQIRSLDMYFLSREKEGALQQKLLADVLSLSRERRCSPTKASCGCTFSLARKYQRATGASNIPSPIAAPDPRFSPVWNGVADLLRTGLAGAPSQLFSARRAGAALASSLAPPEDDLVPLCGRYIGRESTYCPIRSFLLPGFVI